MNEIIVRVDGDDVPSSGAMSYASWKNPAVLKALREVFHTKDSEVLLGVRISEDGIKGYFEYK
jgi:hypothetical protein